jgi:hypothetical protein
MGVSTGLASSAAFSGCLQISSLHFLRSKMATDQLRCPYCVDGGTFRLLTPIVGGELFRCELCGHLSYPTNYAFKSDLWACECGNCRKLKSPHEFS